MWLEVIKTLLGAAQRQQDLVQEQRARISRMYSEMHDLLARTAVELQGDEYPFGSCSTMKALSQGVVSSLKGKLSDDELADLEVVLLSCSQLEGEFANRRDPETIRSLYEAAGGFKALSMLYSV